jgi:predicted nucleic acid-binding protein
MPDRILVDTSAWIEFFRKKESSISLMLRRREKIGFHNRDISSKAQVSRRSGLMIMKKACCAP